MGEFRQYNIRDNENSIMFANFCRCRGTATEIYVEALGICDDAIIASDDSWMAYYWSLRLDSYTWLEFSASLLISACITATDPILAQSVVSGKFAQRVPGHLRNLLSAESGCNDGMAFPFYFFL